MLSDPWLQMAETFGRVASISDMVSGGTSNRARGAHCLACCTGVKAPLEKWQQERQHPVGDGGDGSAVRHSFAVARKLYMTCLHGLIGFCLKMES